MQYRDFGGKINFKTSALGFGAMRLPCRDGFNSGANTNVDIDESFKMIRYAIDMGVNYIDTAYTYHKGISEEVIGKALKEGYRDKVMLADKSPVFLITKESEFDEMLETQLKRLDDEYIDVYLLHSLSWENFENVVLKFDILDKVERAKKSGKIGHIGFSFHDDFTAFEKILNGYNGWEICQIQLNYMDIEKQAGLKGMQKAAQKGLAVVIMEPMLGGNLATPPKKIKQIFERSKRARTPVQWALDFLWDKPEISVVLSGMSSMKQVEQNIQYAEQSKIGAMSEQDKSILNEVRKQFIDFAAVPCTGCSYCMPCPQGVDIPRNIEIYNELKTYDNPAIAHYSYNDMIGWNGEECGAVSCIGCGLCEENCPQKINIGTLMTNIADIFGKK